jgi:hypothetical protein
VAQQLCQRLGAAGVQQQQISVTDVAAAAAVAVAVNGAASKGTVAC